MILHIILLILIILIVAILLLFLFYIMLPSIHNQNKITEDPVLSDSEIEYIKPNVSTTDVSENRAIVLCSCNKKFNITRDNFNEAYSCAMVNKYSGTGTDCKFACIGLGDCAKVCTQQAISIINRTAVISNLCIGCGRCTEVCPLGIIRLIPKKTQEYTICANKSDEKSTCSEELNKQKVVWNEKKDFKIWTTCYKMIKNILKS
ncbi:MAG: 4Fe-4S binding protein [Treponema sp.]|nr:4Fe-4S binding protein [Treponema sp.]